MDLKGNHDKHRKLDQDFLLRVGIVILIFLGLLAGWMIVKQVLEEHSRLVKNWSFEKGMNKWELVEEDDQAEIISFVNKRKELSAIAAFQYLPSEGDHLLAIRNAKSHVRQKIKNLDTKKTYLLLFDAKNEYGTKEPRVSVLDENKRELVSQQLTMQLVQTGWVTGGMEFIPTSDVIYISLGNDAESNQEYSNFYDSIRLFAFNNQSEVDEYLNDHDLKLNEHYITEQPIKHKKLLRDKYYDYQKDLENKYQQLDMPIYNLKFNEKELWNHEGLINIPNLEITYPKYMPFGHEKMIKAKLTINGKDEEKVRIKTIGSLPDEHIIREKSYRIDLNKDERVDLISLINNHYSQGKTIINSDEGLESNLSQNDFVFLTINNIPIGSYLYITREIVDEE